MKIVICGAGQVGSYAAEQLAGANHNITLIDNDGERLRAIEDSLDVGTLQGNCAEASVLRDAGCADADMLIAATDRDEVNLLTVSLAKGVGTRRTIARVHHRAYFENHGLDYQAHLGIDHLICPEYSTSIAIAQTLRNPGALAIENFARGRIEIQEFEVSPDAPAIDTPLAKVTMPRGTLLLAVTRNQYVFLPDANTAMKPGDLAILAGNTETFQEARRLFHSEKNSRRNVVIMGGPPLAVWLCRSLRSRSFAIRLFETNRARAEELADKLDWVTIIHADPTDPNVFAEENIAHADVFVALLDDDEHNILGSAWAKSMGVDETVVLVQRPKYLHLYKNVNIDRSFSPRHVAVTEIERAIDDRPIKFMASLAKGVLDLFQVSVGSDCKILNKPLKEVSLAPHWIITAIRRGSDVRVPGRDDDIRAGDMLLVAGQHGMDAKLKDIFGVGRAS